MGQISEESTRTHQISGNQQDASYIAYRLDTSKLLAEMYKFLTGKITVYELDDKGNVIEKVKIFGEEKANKQGVQEIMAQLNSVINAQGVQGNFKFEQYVAYIKEAHIRFTVMLIINRSTWNINVSDIPSIVGQYVNMIRPFASRTIDNLERSSYEKSVIAKELNTIIDKAKGNGWFKGDSG